MSWWEAKRLGGFILGIDGLVAAACIGLCLAFGATSRGAFATALFVAALALSMLAASGAGGMMSHVPMAPGHGGDHFRRTLENEVLAGQRAQNRQYEMSQQKQYSWALAFFLAAVPLLAASITLMFGFD